MVKGAIPPSIVLVLPHSVLTIGLHVLAPLEAPCNNLGQENISGSGLCQFWVGEFSCQCESLHSSLLQQLVTFRMVAAS